MRKKITAEKIEMRRMKEKKEKAEEEEEKEEKKGHRKQKQQPGVFVSNIRIHFSPSHQTSFFS